MSQKVLLNALNVGFIKNISLFNGLSETDKELLLRDGSIYSYLRKKPLFRHGDPIMHFYVVCSGTIRLYHETPDGCEVTTDILIAGDSICAADIFSSLGMYQTHAEAVIDATVMEFSTEWLKKTAQRFPIIAFNLLSMLSQQTHKLKTEAENQSNMSALQLTACFLQQTCVFNGFNPAGFILPYSKSLIASRIGMKLETLSRTLPKLTEIGIASEGRHIALRDLATIKQNVCDHCPGTEHCHAYDVLHQKN